MKNSTLLSKSFFVAGLIFFSGLAQAQNDAVTSAFLYNKDGEFDKAKEAIDQASNHEKTKDKPKTWYFRGLIYKNILTTQNPKYKALQADAPKQTYESFAKAVSLSKPGDEFHDNSAKEIQNLWGIFLNDGIVKYQEKKNAEAIASYEIAQAIQPKDTTAFLYGFYAAEQIPDYEKSKYYTYKLFELGRKSPEMFISLSNIAKRVEKKDSALAHIQAGRALYPNNKNLALIELEMYFAAGKGDEARKKLEEAIKLDSTNANLYAILGNLYDQEAADKKKSTKDQDGFKQKAISAYKKAIQLDPKNMESQFNLGVYYFNRGADILKKTNAMDIPTYQAKGKKMEADAQNEFKLALPYFEACYQLNNKDEGVQKSLKNTYERLGRSADADKVGK
jgi:tetratricopeptide (TPR) repeat protein